MHWPLTTLQTLLLLALLLATIDLFFATEALLHIAYLLVAFAFARLWQTNILAQVLFGLVTWGVLVGLHYSLFRTIVQPWLHSVLAPEKYQSLPTSLVGRYGEYCVVDGKPMVRVRDELWPCTTSTGLAAGDQVLVEDVGDGIVAVVPAVQKER